MSEPLTEQQLMKQRIAFLSRMNGAVYSCHMSGANSVEIAETGQEPVTASTLEEAIDIAMARNSKYGLG